MSATPSDPTVTDLQLGEFARQIDAALGERRWVMFVTADHGVAPIPEQAVRWKLPAARDPLGPADRRTGQLVALEHELEAVLRRQLQAEGDAPLVEAVTSTEVFFNRQHPRLAADGGAAAAALARDWLLERPSIADAFTRQELLSGAAASDAILLQLARRAFHPARSGDVLFVLAPYQIQGSAAATHGSPWHYDRHVPLLVVGDVRAARVDRPVSPAAIAATAARLLDVQQPSLAEEESLPEVVLK
jgi:hypothetical protein